MPDAERTSPLPGEILRDELEKRGWTQAEFALILGRNSKAVNEIIVGRRSITPRTARELATALGDTTPEYWLELEARYQLSQVDDAGEGIAKRARIFERAPVSEMGRRGWIRPTDDADELESRLLRFFGVKSLEEEPDFWTHAARKSTPYSRVTPSQWAWLVRARQLAEHLQAARFTDKRLEAGIEALRQCLPHTQEIRKVPHILAEAGVRLVVVEPLSGIKIDGACFWLNAHSPVIALSARYDRVDWFWHTLLHELGHVRARDGLRGDACPVDVEMFGDGESSSSDQEKPASERAADEFAVSFLVDRDALKDFIIRVGPLYSKTRILGFAGRMKVHPGVVVGQLQHLGEISYAHSRAMLEKVRNTLTASALTDGWGCQPTLGSL